MIKLKVGEVYDISKIISPVIYYHILSDTIFSPRVVAIVGSNDKHKWRLIWRPPCNVYDANPPNGWYHLRAHFSNPIPLYNHKYKYIKLVWGFFTWNGIGEPILFHLGRGGWYQRNPQQFYAYLFDFVYTSEYALNLANYILNHRSSYLAWSSPVNPSVTLKDIRATKFGWIQKWNVFLQPIGARRGNSYYMKSTGKYGTINMPEIIPSVFPPGTFRTPNNKKIKIKYVDLVPGWKYQEEPVHVVNSNKITVYNFIALINPTPFLFPVEIFKPEPKISNGIFNSNLSLLASVNGKDKWIKRGVNNVSGEIVIDHWRYEVPPRKEITNIRIVNGKISFKSNYSGKAELVVDGKKEIIRVGSGVNYISIPNGKVICIKPI